MPEKRIAAVITSLEDFEVKLPDFLDKNKKLALLLDYDGTLAPLVDNPDETAMPFGEKAKLKSLAKHPNVFLAIISGRGLKDVQQTVGITGITYAGNHGIEIEFPDGYRHDYKLPDDLHQKYVALVKELKAKACQNKAWVEDKRVSLSYHYRETPLELKESQKQMVIKIIESYGFRANPSHEGIEATPPINWNKGEAALFILRHKFGDKWAGEANVIFAGDDTTDEDAMKALQGLGKSFIISSDQEIQTFADFRLPRQGLVTDLLKWIASVYGA